MDKQTVRFQAVDTWAGRGTIKSGRGTDLDPMDISIWSILDVKVSIKKDESIDSIKACP